MEAYFHSEPRIEEWVNQIIENIVTVDQLKGVDSEVEFEKGREIVTNLAHLLQGISVFPPEYLEDGLKQLLEQQLPGLQAINVVAFQKTMNKMLREGMMQAIDTQNKETLDILEIPASSEKDTPNIEEHVREHFGKNHTVHGDESTETLVSEFENELVTEMALPALVSVKVSELVQLKLNIESSVGDSTPTEAEPGAPLPLVEVGVSRLDEPVDHLKNVLGNMFTNVPVLWNQNLMGQTFLAQVEDILIWPHDPLNPCDVATLNKQGWKVYECSSNDLMFPRRLERGIRQIQRLGKQGNKSNNLVSK